MQERNIMNGAFAGVTTATYFDFINFLQSSKWLLLLGVALIILDFRFGIKYSKVKKEEIKRSRAVRRTINKVVDYFCWISLAYLLGMAFGTPFGINVIPFVVMVVIYGAELESVIVNYFGSKGRTVKWDFFKWFNKKTDLDIEEKKDE